MKDFMLRIASLGAKQALLYGVIIGGLWFFLLYDDGSKQVARLAELNRQIQIEKAKVAESESATKEIKEMQTALAGLIDQFRIVSAQLPTDLQMAEVIRTVDKVAQATGVNLKSKEPRPSIKQDTIEILPLKVIGTATFSEVGMFLYYLSTIDRIVRIRSFTISTPAELQKGTRLNLEAEVASYRFVPHSGEKVKK